MAGGLGDGAESTYGFAPAGGTTGGGGGAISSGDRRGYAACSAGAGDGAEASGAGALASGLGSIGGDWGTVSVGGGGDCQTGARWGGLGRSASLPACLAGERVELLTARGRGDEELDTSMRTR